MFNASSFPHEMLKKLANETKRAEWGTKGPSSRLAFVKLPAFLIESLATGACSVAEYFIVISYVGIIFIG